MDHAKRMRLVRNNAILDLWAEGKTARQIAERLTGISPFTVASVVERARSDNDPRAVSRYEECRARHAEVLNLWDNYLTGPEIAELTGETLANVKSIVRRARESSDTRAHTRRAERDAFACAFKDSGGPAVTLAPVEFRGGADSLRPLRMSIDRERDRPRQTCVTAQLMGDPPPHRSALGRECLPHEYASGTREGRWRDPMLGAGRGNIARRISG